MAKTRVFTGFWPVLKFVPKFVFEKISEQPCSKISEQGKTSSFARAMRIAHQSVAHQPPIARLAKFPSGSAPAVSPSKLLSCRNGIEAKP